MGEKTNRGKRGPILGRKAGQVSTSITRSVDHMPRFRAKNNTDLLLPFVPPKTTTVGYVSAHFLRSVSTGSAKSFFILSFFFSLSLSLPLSSFPFLFLLCFACSFRGTIITHRNDYNFSQKVSIIVIVRGFTVDRERDCFAKGGRERESVTRNYCLRVSGYFVDLRAI